MIDLIKRLFPKRKPQAVFYTYRKMPIDREKRKSVNAELASNCGKPELVQRLRDGGLI